MLSCLTSWAICVFGENLNTKEPGENKLKQIPHAIMKKIYAGYCISQSALLDLFLFLQPRGLNALLQRLHPADVKDYNELIERFVDIRIEAHNAGKQVERQDMFHFLLTAIDPETNLPAYKNRSHLLSEARLMLVTGTDTTSSTTCALFFYIAHNPRVLQKLTTEIRSYFRLHRRNYAGPEIKPVPIPSRLH